MKKENSTPRACMVAYTFYEVDNRVRRYAETLAAQGWQVDAVVLASKNKPKKYSLRGVTVHAIQERTPNEKRPLTYLCRLCKFLWRSFCFVTLHHIRQPYSVIHVHSVPDFEVFAVIGAKLLGAKVILDIHDIVPELFLNKFGKSENAFLFKLLLLIEKASGKFADHVIIANHIWYEKITSRSVEPKKCSVVMNYPDPEIFGNRLRSRKADDEFHMIYPGTLSKHQGISTAIEAMNLLRDKASSLFFHIYGSGTDEQLLRVLAAKLALTERVIFHEPVSIEEVADVMANADIGVEPKIRNSFSDEAFSTKILEFMMLKVPVIASDTKVHKYYLPDKTIRYFKAGDPQDLAGAIMDMYNNKKLRNDYAGKGFDFVKEYTWASKKSIYTGMVNNLTGAAFNSCKSAAY